MKQTAMALALLFAANIAWAQQPELVKDPPGPAVGEKAPDFELKDQYGKTQTLKSLGKDKKIAIVFYRSGQW